LGAMAALIPQAVEPERGSFYSARR
jgi:hypothetical protein